MDLGTIVRADGVVLGLDAHSKKHAIQDVSATAAKVTGLPERAIFDTLLQRERLGSTGVGNGIAIPHGKLVELKELTGLFFRLKEPINFDALDNAPVDLIFVLLAPEDAGAEHLKALAKIAGLLRAPGMVAQLRSATDRTEEQGLLTKTTVDVG